MSNGGNTFAYLVKSPDVESNENRFHLFIRSIDDKPGTPGRSAVSGTSMSSVRWIDDDTHISMLATIAGRKGLFILDVNTGKVDAVGDSSEDIESYTIDGAGDLVIYAVTDPQVWSADATDPTPEDLAGGYRSRFGEHHQALVWLGDSEVIYLRRKGINGRWSAPEALQIENPFNHVHMTHLAAAEELSLSPNGKQLLVSFVTDTIPENWKSDPIVSIYAFDSVMILYDIGTGTSKLALNSISPSSTPVWSSDSRSFLVNAHSPIGSGLEQRDIHDNRTSGADESLFAVDANSGGVEEVARNIPNNAEAPLSWQSSGDIIVHTVGASIGRYRRFLGAWREVQRIPIPKADGDRFKFLASNGEIIVGVHETVSAPEDVFVYERGEGRIRLLTEINQQLEKLHFAPVRTIQWRTESGENITGLLFMPPDYSPGKRYPLVIQTKGDMGVFTCDSGSNHDPAFAPQPIASAGLMYLVRTTEEGFKLQEDVNHRPRGYPGGIGEAVHEMNIWDDAVDLLDRKGMVDRSRVGIIGFSRTGWEVEFDLVHARTRYAAATAADNVQYSLGEYLLMPGFAHADEAMYAGPPFGATLNNWRRYSISFNLDKIHTPLLIESMGYGIRDDDPARIPVSLAVRYELTRGLNELRKPVELYYYPNEDHQPDHPKARLESLQRNVDWYRFWLQGYEDPDPSKSEQYRRWRAMKVLHDEDVKNTIWAVSTSPNERMPDSKTTIGH
jgi:dipeptidyl aminopeptidase/acylaminoacyl peptidase